MPQLDTANLLWGQLFGSIGFAYFMYGRKQKQGIAVVVGLVLMLLPYLIENTLGMVLVGLLCMGVPYWLKS